MDMTLVNDEGVRLYSSLAKHQLEDPPCEILVGSADVYVDSDVLCMDRETSDRFMEHLKRVGLSLLNESIMLLGYDDCAGCRAQQRDDGCVDVWQGPHTCDDDIPYRYFDRNYDAIMTRLWNNNFLRTIGNFLFLKKMLISPSKIAGAVEIMLHDLAQTDTAIKAIDSYYASIPLGPGFLNSCVEHRLISNTWQPKLGYFRCGCFFFPCIL